MPGTFNVIHLHGPVHSSGARVLCARTSFMRTSAWVRGRHLLSVAVSDPCTCSSPGAANAATHDTPLGRFGPHVGSMGCAHLSLSLYIAKHPLYVFSQALPRSETA